MAGLSCSGVLNRPTVGASLPTPTDGRPAPEDVDMAATELDLAMAFYTALRKLDLAAMFDVLDPDVRLRHPEAVPWGGDAHGYAGVRRFLERLVLHVNGR